MSETETVQPVQEPNDKAPKATQSKTRAKRESAKPRAGRPAGSANRGTVKSIEDTINDVMTAAAMAAMATGNIPAAVIIESRGPKVASAWAELARVNPRVKEMLDRMLKGGAWGGVIFSSLSLAMPVMESYGVLPSGLPNPFGLKAEEAESIMEMRANVEAMMASAAAANGSS